MVAVAISLVSNAFIACIAFADSSFEAYNELSNSKWIPDEFAFESLHRLIADTDDYLIVAGVDASAPMTAEALLVINNGTKVKYIYMSSIANRMVICETQNNTSIDLDFPSLDPSGNWRSVHSEYMVVEKRIGGEMIRFAFENATPDVDQKIDAFRVEYFESLLSSCTSYEVTDL